MAKPNYAFEKRQRELAKKKKKEEKAARKAHPRPEDGAPEGAEGVESAEGGSAQPEAHPGAQPGPSAA
ncbi:MAG: hypothetical protein ACOYLV_15105 [Rubrivivax sp.]